MRRTKSRTDPTPLNEERVGRRTAKTRDTPPAKNGTVASATSRAEVILQHSQDAARVRRMAWEMMKEADASSIAPSLLQDLSRGIEAMDASGDVPFDLLTLARAALREALALKSRADVLKDLSKTLAELAVIEHGVADSIRALLFQNFDRLMDLRVRQDDAGLQV